MRPYLSTSLLLFFLLLFGISTQAKTEPELLARQALSNDAVQSANAISKLRALGPEGLSVLFRIYADEIDRQIANPAATPQWQRLKSALDAISQQKDSYLSGLYWYTDLGQAKAAARATGRPILSLRLLGQLSEEFSCANSRFFRTVLYSNLEVSKVLREDFILHWKSVRPAPRVTINFGDGRRLERTLTGNSIHYVLDADGRLLDAMPGLYGPKAFLHSLMQAEEVYERVKGIDFASRMRALDEYHRALIRSTTADWVIDAQKAGGKVPERLLPKPTTDGNPKAIEIAPLAITKSGVELNILRAITRDAEALGVMTDEVTWTKIALQHILESKLDDRSLSLIRRQTGRLFAVADGSGLTPEIKLTNLVQKLQLTMALDSIRNEYILHTKLHAWLVADPSRMNLEAFNDKVYAQLFLTPKSDPWLGLFSSDTYVGLENAGLER